MCPGQVWDILAQVRRLARADGLRWFVHPPWPGGGWRWFSGGLNPRRSPQGGGAWLNHAKQAARESCGA